MRWFMRLGKGSESEKAPHAAQNAGPVRRGHLPRHEPGRAIQQHFNIETAGNLQIVLPSVEEQQAIADYLDRETAKLDALMAKVRTAMERLQEYRTALISAAVTGQIDVRQAVVRQSP